MMDVEHVINTYQEVVVPLSWLEEKIKTLGRAEDHLEKLKNELLSANQELLVLKEEMESMEMQIRILQKEAEKEYGIG